MDGPILTRAATAPVTHSNALAPSSRVYARDDNFAERGSRLASQDMQRHEIRQRQRHDPVDDDDSSVTFREELTPTSSSDREATEVRQAQWSAVSEFRQLLAKLWPQPLSRTEIDNSIAAKRKIEYDKIKPHKLEKDHVDGLPRFAALQDSNDSFCIFRKFGPAAARILVVKEVELDQLMTKLNKLDKKDDENPTTRYRLRSADFYDGCDPEQNELLQELEVKVKDYYDFLLKYVDIRGLSHVYARDHRSVHTWMIDNRPLYEGEDAFILSVDDFITARRVSGTGQQHGNKLADKLESYIAQRPKSWLHGFINGENERSRTSNPLVRHFSPAQLAILARVVASVLAISTVLIPVLILFLAGLSRASMAAIVGCFVLVFMVAISVFLDVTPHDLFIGILAYSAVLVALLSNLAQGMGSTSSSTWANVTAAH